MAGQCIFYLMNFNLSPRCIWLTRHGESLDNKLGKIGKEMTRTHSEGVYYPKAFKASFGKQRLITLPFPSFIFTGGDAPLSARGKKYGACLARFIKQQRIEQDEIRRCAAEQREAGPSSFSTSSSQQRERTVAVWTSMLRRTKETVEEFDPIEYDIKEMRLLNEIYAGICEELTYAQIQERYPEEFQARKINKLFYRYPGETAYSFGSSPLDNESLCAHQAR